MQNINSVFSKTAVLFIPLRILLLFAILFLMTLINSYKYFTFTSPVRFWTTIFFTYLLPVSVVTVLIMLPLDFVWVLITGYEFPLNYFTFLKNPILIRGVRVLFDAFFSFFLTDSVMKFSRNMPFVRTFVDEGLYQKFRQDNKRSEMKKAAFFTIVILAVYFYKYIRR